MTRVVRALLVLGISAVAVALPAAAPVRVMLLDVESGVAIWSNEYDGSTSEVFEIQDAVAEAVGNVLKSRLVGAPDWQ